MSTRPNFIDLRSASSDTMQSGKRSPRAFPSPRMQHFAGDVPPSMSPLEMFAMQSRLLAKQLDESQRDGRRVSRLPPLTTGDPITNQRLVYDRSRSAEATAKALTPGSSPRVPQDEASGTLPEVEEPDFRPKSFYPRMSQVPPVEDDEEDTVDPSPDQTFVTPAELPPVHTNDYFGVPRAKSPETVNPATRSADAVDRHPWVYPPRNQEPFNRYNEPQRGMSIESTSTKSYNGSLAPPKSPHVRQDASIRSIPQDSSDDELSASTGGSGFSRDRKLSSSSGISMPHSPFSPFAQAHNRSPSLNSEYSIGGSRLARPTLNFSRPISRQSQQMEMGRQPSFDSRPSVDAVRTPFSSESRQPSIDSQRFIFHDDTIQTPSNLDNEMSPDPNPDAPAPSYIYAKFSLPRGRMIQRDSKGLPSDQIPSFEWERPNVPTNVRPTTPLAQRPMTPTRSPRPSIELNRSSPRPSYERFQRSSPRPSAEHLQRGSPRPSAEQYSRSPRPSADQSHPFSRGSPKSSFEQNRQAHHRPPPTPVQSDDKSEYTESTRSGSTIKASHPRAPAPSLDLNAEDHLAKGIELHERGAARESTYHLRIAARQNNPTAMLLYALACRHGWGMRPNQQEGVQWLRKAADCASLQVVIDEEERDTEQGNPLERKEKQAQFALSIYELGVSHMNGWGIEQDKTLALRCFEIAANWGDADAMAEAGFCYAQGQGCKKDLKKAAKYYRMAEAKGMSMVGNSWIYKPKYADDTPSIESRGRGAKPTTPEKKPRDKSRTRTIFGRKKSISQKS